MSEVYYWIGAVVFWLVGSVAFLCLLTYLFSILSNYVYRKVNQNVVFWKFWCRFLSYRERMNRRRHE